MLTSERGQLADASTPRALDRSVCETEIPLCSQRAAARGAHALARQLRGDPDAIAATATRKEPQRRYASVAALSDDLDRYLKGLPVEARRGAFAYRAAKLIRRHRVGAVAAALVLASLTGGVATTLYQARRAEHRFQQVRKLANSVLFGVHDRLQNLAGATETREWAVRTALEYMDDLARDAGGDNSILAELAAAYLKIGDVQGYPLGPNLGYRDAALVSYRKAESIATRLATRGGGPEFQRLLARSHQRIGAVLRSTSHTAASIAEYGRALALIEPLYASNPANTDDAGLLATTLLTLGQAHAATGNAAEAARLWLRSTDVGARTAEMRGGAREAQLARTGKYVIRALMYRGDLDAAERTGIEGVRIREAASAAEPGNAALRRVLANAYGDLGYVYFHSVFLSFGDWRTAAGYQKKSLAIARELAAADPSNAAAQSDLAISEIDYCSAVNPYAPATAIGYCRDGLRLAGLWPQISAEDGLAELSLGLARLGRMPEALDALRSAIQIRRTLYERDPEHFAVRQKLLRGGLQMAALLRRTGDRAAALDRLRESVALAEELASAVPANPLARRDLADAYEELGSYFEGRDRAQAQRWYRKCLDLWTAWPRDFHSGRMDRERSLRMRNALARQAMPGFP